MSGPSHEETIGRAYIEGMRQARDGEQPANPYFEHEQQYIAYNSGYRDQMTWKASAGGR